MPEIDDPFRALSTLEHGWSTCWPNTPPVADALRVRHRDLWVRFHALPESKRYPETETEYATILSRHHSILDQLGLKDRCFVISARFGDDASGLFRLDSSVHRNAEAWRVVPAEDEDDVPAHLYASAVAYPSSEVDALLRAVADEQLIGTMIAPLDVSWIYHPYDGGGDVIARSEQERDALRETYSAWLSPFFHGL